MKPKLFIAFALALTLLNATDCPLKQIKEIKEAKCPESIFEIKKDAEKSIINLAQKDKDSKLIFDIYSDVLKNINKTEDIEKYLNDKSFKEFIKTEIFEKLIVDKLESKDKYEESLLKIDKNNPYWCKELK